MGRVGQHLHAVSKKRTHHSSIRHTNENSATAKVELLRASRFVQLKSLVTLAIDPVPDVKVAITHMIAKNTAIAQIIEGRTWIWILDHELIADSQSVAKRFL